MERWRRPLCLAFALASNTAFVISSTNSGMPSVRSMMSCRTLAGQGLLPMTRSIMAATSRSPSRLSGEGGHMRPSDPRRVKLRSVRDDQQHVQAWYFVYDSTKQFEASRVGPVCILENHQHWNLERRARLVKQALRAFFASAVAVSVQGPDNVRHSAATASPQEVTHRDAMSRSARAARRACRVSLAGCRRA